MIDYISVKKSQITFYKDVPFYYLSKEGEGVLFKQSGVFINKSQISKAKGMNIFISSDDKDSALKELIAALNTELEQKIASKGVKEVRLVLCDIVGEALTGSLDNTYQALPDTIEILFRGYSKNSELLESLFKISTNSDIIIEHSINVLSLTMLYCCFHGISVDTTKKIGLAALLHDIGTTQIDKEIVNNEQKLSEKEFEIYKTHTFKGHDFIKKFNHFDEMTARVALEHHEQLDGSGYPRGVTDISFESQLIGLIDSYEPLTYRGKIFRKAQQPYDVLKLLKEDVIAKKYNIEIFKKLCVCLTK